MLDVNPDEVSAESIIPVALKMLGTPSVGETLPPTLAPRSVELASKQIEQSLVTNATRRAN